MNTYLPKILKFVSVNNVKSALVIKRWHFYGYFLLAFIFYSIVYSVYGDTGTTATDAAGTAIQFPVTQPAPPTPIVVPDLNGLINVFQDAGTGWQKTLIVFATNLFYLLAAIEIAWTSIRLTLRQADLGEWTSEMVYQIMFIGFFYMLLINSVEWSNDIIQSFRMAGQAASLEGGGTNGVSPTIIFNIGYNMASKLLATVTFVQEGDAFFLVLSAFIILICAALIAAFMILVLIETYFAIYAGIIFMGFGGSRFTSQIAVKTLQYTLAAGGKLFFIQLLGGLIEKQMTLVQQEFLTFTTIHNTVIFKIIGIFIICVIIVKRAPEILQSMLNGINFNFTFLPPSSDTGNAAAPAPVNSTTTINNLTSAAAPSGYTPPLAGMFNTAAQNIPAENIGNRLLDVANTTFHTAAFSESGSISTDTSSFGTFASPVAPSSQANTTVATPNMSNAATNVDTQVSSTRATDIPSPMTATSATASVATSQPASPSSATTSQIDNQNADDADNMTANQTAASSTAANASANQPNMASANNMGSTPADGYQPTGLGGRFGGAGSGTGSNNGANAPDQANQLNQPGQAGQNNQDVASSTSPLSGQQKMTATADIDMPKDSNQGGQNVSTATSALGGQQSQPQPSQQAGIQVGEQASGAKATKNDASNTSLSNTAATTTETLKSPSEANDKASSSAAQSVSGSTSQSPTQPTVAANPNVAATSVSATTAPGSAATSPAAATTSTAPGSAAASPATATTSTASGLATASPAAATTSTASGLATASLATATTSTASGLATASPAAAATSTVAMPAATTAPAATPAPPSGNTPVAQKTVSNSGGHKSPADKSAPLPVNDKNKAADKNIDKNQNDDKSKKLKDILKDEKDKKNKSDNPDLDDDSFDDKPKKPKYPKGDHHDEK